MGTQMTYVILTDAKNIGTLASFRNIKNKYQIWQFHCRRDSKLIGPILTVLKIAKGFIVILAIQINPTMTFSD